MSKFERVLSKSDEQLIIDELGLHKLLAAVGRHIIQLAEQAVLQSPEIQALRKNAERFEFLRDNALLFSQIEQRGVSGWMVGRRDHGKTRFYTYNGQELVEAIDAALEQQA